MTEMNAVIAQIRNDFNDDILWVLSIILLIFMITLSQTKNRRKSDDFY